jgi:arylsulfate sulfotransferase
LTRWTTRAAAPVLLAALLVSCSGDDGGSSATTTAPPTTRPGPEPPPSSTVESDAGLFTMAFGPHSVLSAVITVDSETPVSAVVSATATDRQIAVAFADTSRHLELPLVGLRAETTYEVTVQLRDVDVVTATDTATWITPPLPDWFPEIRVATAEPERMAPGVTLFDLSRWGDDPHPGEPVGLLVALDEEGEVVWYYPSETPVGDTRMTPQGTILSMYPLFGIRELDLLGNVVRAWELGDEQRPDGPIPIHSDTYDLVDIHHEANLLPNGDILTLSRQATELTPEERAFFCPDDPAPFGLTDDVILEFAPDGEIVHEWLLSDIVDPMEVPGTEMCSDDQEYRDWAHANAAIIDEEHNAVIVSARHIDLLVAFRYEDDAEGPSGELLWTLGPEGTMPLDGEYSYHQHAPELEADGSLLVYDNGNHRPGGEYSRAVRYAIDDSAPDTADWTATQVWQHRVPDIDGQPLYANFLGDVDLLPNGNVLIDHGGINQFDPPARGRIIEVIPEGDDGGPIVWDVSFEDTFVSYRAQRVPDLYVPG